MCQSNRQFCTSNPGVLAAQRWTFRAHHWTAVKQRWFVKNHWNWAGMSGKEWSLCVPNMYWMQKRVCILLMFSWLAFFGVTLYFDCIVRERDPLTLNRFISITFRSTYPTSFTLSTFILREENIPYFFISLRIFLKDWVSLTRNVTSSANDVSLISIFRHLKPRIDLSFLIWMKRVFKHKRNR